MRSKDKKSALDREIDAIVKDMAAMNPDTKAYASMVDNLKKLSEAKQNLKPGTDDWTKQLQFSQRIVWYTFIFSMAIVLLVLASHIVMTIFGFTGLSQEFITVVTVYGAITSGLSFTAYAVLQAWRSGTENKYCGGDRTTYNEFKYGTDETPKG